MIDLKKGSTGMAVLILLAIMPAALGQYDTIGAQAAYLDELDKYLQSVAADLKEKLANFDKAGSIVTTGRENVDGRELNVTVYIDADGYILKIYTDNDEMVVQIKLISPDCGPQLIITYNANGSVAKEQTIACKRCSKLTVTYNSDGTMTSAVQDCQLTANNTLTYRLDKNYDLIPETRIISTTACVPQPDCCACDATTPTPAPTPSTAPAPSPVIDSESGYLEQCSTYWNYCETTRQWEEVTNCR